jgi:hypothetical protein
MLLKKAGQAFENPTRLYSVFIPSNINAPLRLFLLYLPFSATTPLAAGFTSIFKGFILFYELNHVTDFLFLKENPYFSNQPV